MKLDEQELKKRFESKKRDARKRGIDFKLTLDDLKVLFLRNNGYCDYTGVPFDNDKHKISIERINDKKGYERGNVCLTSAQVNRIKDYTLDKTEIKVVRIDQGQEEILKVIQEKVTPEYQKFLSYKYNALCKFEFNVYKNHFKGIDYSKFYDKVSGVVTQKVELSRNNEGVLKMSDRQIASDVRIASYYSDMAKHASSEKKDFTVSFAEFKAKFSGTKCKLTGEPVEMAQKVFILLDQDKGYTKDNIVLVGKDVGAKMVEASKLLGMSIPEMAKNLNPFVKDYVPKKKPAPKTPLVSLSSIMKNKVGDKK
ncbi:MAG: hypothetical protein KGZ89_06760 [Actinobacteria bacterium]|nr:hypothetical protein [Actinomycetota bacterium]